MSSRRIARRNRCRVRNPERYLRLPWWSLSPGAAGEQFRVLIQEKMQTRTPRFVPPLMLTAFTVTEADRAARVGASKGSRQAVLEVRKESRIVHRGAHRSSRGKSRFMLPGRQFGDLLVTTVASRM